MNNSLTGVSSPLLLLSPLLLQPLLHSFAACCCLAEVKHCFSLLAMEAAVSKMFGLRLLAEAADAGEGGFRFEVLTLSLCFLPLLLQPSPLPCSCLWHSSNSGSNSSDNGSYIVT